MFYPHSDDAKNQKKSSDANNKKILTNMPTLSMHTRINQHEKQLVETDTILHHKETTQLLGKNKLVNLEEKKHFVITRIARKLWANFCMQGKETAMLRYLHSVIRSEHNNNLQFRYFSKNTELIIMKKKENDMEPVSRTEYVDMVNRAWQVSQDVVSGYIDESKQNESEPNKSKQDQAKS